MTTETLHVVSSLPAFLAERSFICEGSYFVRQVFHLIYWIVAMLAAAISFHIGYRAVHVINFIKIVTGIEFAAVWKMLFMPKQIGPIFITGTIGNITYYQLDGVYYCRKKSSLSGKKVKTHRHFKRTMENAGIMADASRIASAVYRLIPKSAKQHTMYREMTGIAIDLLKLETTKDETLELLLEKYMSKEVKEKRRIKESKELKEKKRIKEGHQGKELNEIKESEGAKNLVVVTAENEIKGDTHCNETKTTEQKREVIKNKLPDWMEAPGEVVYIPLSKRELVNASLHKEFTVPWYKMN